MDLLYIWHGYNYWSKILLPRGQNRVKVLPQSA